MLITFLTQYSFHQDFSQVYKHFHKELVTGLFTLPSYTGLLSCTVGMGIHQEIPMFIYFRSPTVFSADLAEMWKGVLQKELCTQSRVGFIVALWPGQTGAGTEEQTWLQVLSAWDKHCSFPPFSYSLCNFGRMKREQGSSQRCWNSVRFCSNKYFTAIPLKNTDLFSLEKRSFLLVTKLQSWITIYCPHLVRWCWLGVYKKPGGDTARTADQRDIPDHRASRSAIKPGRFLGGMCYSGTGWALVCCWWVTVLICFTCYFLLLLSFLCYSPFHYNY